MRFIIGPCAIENRDHAVETATFLKDLEQQLRFEGHDVEIIYKSSYSKANRTKISSSSGVGIEEGLEALLSVKHATGMRVTSDVHTVVEAFACRDVLDVIQIPHQMCKNTDLIQAAAKTGQIVSVKKGTFMKAEDFAACAEKIRAVGNTQEIIAIERGNAFGYDSIVVDMLNINRLATDRSITVCLDASHPGDGWQNAARLAYAGVAAGAEMIFLEAHPDPMTAPCDGFRMIPFEELPGILRHLCRLRRVTEGWPCE